MVKPTLSLTQMSMPLLQENGEIGRDGKTEEEKDNNPDCMEVPMIMTMNLMNSAAHMMKVSCQATNLISEIFVASEVEKTERVGGEKLDREALAVHSAHPRDLNLTWMATEWPIVGQIQKRAEEQELPE